MSKSDVPDESDSTELDRATVYARVREARRRCTQPVEYTDGQLLNAGRGWAIIAACAVSFSVGHWVMTPEPVTHTQTKYVTQPVTDLKTQVVTLPPVAGPLSQGCRDLLAAGDQARQGTRQLSEEMAKLSAIIDQIAPAIYSKDTDLANKLQGDWRDVQQSGSSAWSLIGFADADANRAAPGCPH